MNMVVFSGSSTKAATLSAVLLTRTILLVSLLASLACAGRDKKRDFRPRYKFSQFSAEDTLACCPDGKPTYTNDTCCQDGFMCDARNSTGSGPICIEIPQTNITSTDTAGYTNTTTTNTTQYTNTTSTNTTEKTNTTSTNTIIANTTTTTTSTNTISARPTSTATLTSSPAPPTGTNKAAAAASASFSGMLASAVGLVTVMGIMSI